MEYHQGKENDIFYSSSKGFPDMLTKILKTPEGMRDINKFNSSRHTPLMVACLNKRRKTAKILLEYGAKISPVEYNPLYCAITTGSLYMIKLLYLHDVNMTERDTNNISVLGQAGLGDISLFLILCGNRLEDSDSIGGYGFPYDTGTYRPLYNEPFKWYETKEPCINVYGGVYKSKRAGILKQMNEYEQICCNIKPAKR